MTSRNLGKNTASLQSFGVSIEARLAVASGISAHDRAQMIAEEYAAASGTPIVDITALVGG